MPELLGAIKSRTHDAVSAEEMTLSLAREAEGEMQIMEGPSLCFSRA